MRSLLWRIKQDDSVLEDSDGRVASVEGGEFGAEEILADESIEDLSDGVLGKEGAGDFVVGVNTGEGYSEYASGLHLSIDSAVLSHLNTWWSTNRTTILISNFKVSMVLPW